MAELSTTQTLEAHIKNRVAELGPVDKDRDALRAAHRKLGGKDIPQEETPDERASGEALLTALATFDSDVDRKKSAMAANGEAYRLASKQLEDAKRLPDFRATSGFTPSAVDSKYQAFYVNALASAKKVLNSGGSADSGAPYLHNDLSANGFGRINTSIYYFVLLFAIAFRDPQAILFLAERMELIVRAMQNGVGKPPPYHPEGKSSLRKALEAEHYYAKKVSFKNDRGETVTTSYLDHPHLTYVRRGVGLFGTLNKEGDQAVENGDNRWSGTDAHMHDIIPRRAVITLIFAVLYQNRDLKTPEGAMSIEALCSWFYKWQYDDMAFWEYRAANSATGAFRGLGAQRKGLRDWKKTIAHDWFQQVGFDWGNALLALLVEGPDDARTKYWESAYETRTKLALGSCLYVPGGNGHETTIFGHLLALPLMEMQNYDARNAWSAGGWLPRYCDDLYPVAQVLEATGAPGFADGRFNRALANNFKPVAWISETQIASRINGRDNRLADGTPIEYPKGHPYRFASDKGRVYPYGTDDEPEDGPRTVASVNQRFRTVQGFEAIACDPTDDLQNIKLYLKMAAKYAGYTPQKGASTVSSSGEFAKHQMVSALIGKRHGVDPRAL